MYSAPGAVYVAGSASFRSYVSAELKAIRSNGTVRRRRATCLVRARAAAARTAPACNLGTLHVQGTENS